MASVDLGVPTLVELLRDEGSDLADVEAKRASGGYPDDLVPTLSAFGNMPGGGVIILGLDEKAGFEATGVYNASDAKKRLAAQLRDSVKPPLTAALEDVEFEGKQLVIARINELNAAHKPCVVKASGRAYLRSYDGDYPLSEQESAAFIAERSTPRYDRDPVPGTSATDLDPELTKIYIASCRRRSNRLATMDEDSLLRHTRIIAPNGELTLGGLYALGTYPQQFVPTLSVSARIAPMAGDPPGTRSSDLTHLDGPLPDLLDQTMDWIHRNTSTRVTLGADGHGRDEPTYPNEAVRELVANALVHRDIGPHALGDRVHLVLENNKLVITNPGGLFGLTVEQLGTRQGGSARNQSLYDIVKDLRTFDGRRIIEGVGTGIIAAREALRRAGMTPPVFLDSGVRFTAIIPQAALLNADDINWLAALDGITGTTEAQRHALVMMRHGRELTNSKFRNSFPMDSIKARAELMDLVDRGLVKAHGSGRARSYYLGADDNTESVSATEKDKTHLTNNGVQVNNEPIVTANAEKIMSALTNGSATTKEIAASAKLSVRQVTYALAKMTDVGQVIVEGGPGRSTKYKLSRTT